MSKGSTTSTQQVPEWQKQMYQDVFRAGQSIAQQPFIPYTGAQVAGFNPDQLRQFEATRGAVESSMGFDPRAGLQQLADAPTPTIAPVTGTTAQIGAVSTPGFATIGDVQAPQFRSLLDADISAYQSPFQTQVIDLAMQDIQRQSDLAQQQAQERAIKAGAFGGSRSALIESEATRPFAEQAARTAAGLRQAGFEQAQQAALADIARQQQLGIFGAEQEQQRALQQAQLQQQAGLLGAEQEQQRALEQARLAQQTGMAELDIAGRAAMMQPELELRRRQQAAGLLGGQLEDQYRALGLLGGIGGQQQALQQRAMDQAYNEFLRAQGYGQQQLGALTSALSGVPALISQRDKKKTGPGDILSSVMGLFS
tara:strand:- start:666 stop:1769 length:1104 start_codon:yes stop_codon:yes gene_type:complete